MQHRAFLESVEQAAANGRRAVQDKLLNSLLQPDDSDDDDCGADEAAAFAVSFSAGEALGLELLEKAGGLLRVKRVVDGGQAEADGRVAAGHVLLRVGDVEVGSMRSFEAVTAAAVGGRFCVTFAPAMEKAPDADASGLAAKVRRLERALEDEERGADELRADAARCRADLEAANADAAAQKHSVATALSAARQERAQLRAEVDDARAAVGRERANGACRLEEAQRGAAEDAERHARREQELEAALAASETQNADDGEIKANGFALEDELLAARQALEQQRADISGAGASARLRERDRATAAAAVVQESVAHLETEVEQLRAAAGDAARKLSDALKRAADAELRAAVATTSPDASLVVRLRAAEQEAHDATDRALRKQKSLDGASADRTALVARNAALQDAVLQLESERDELASNRPAPAPRFAAAYSLQAPLIDRWRCLEAVARAPCGAPLVSALESLDDATFTISLLCRTSLPRMALAVYLFALHAWAFTSVVSRTYSLSVENDVPGRPSSLRGATHFRPI